MQKMYLLLVISTKQDHKEFLNLFERYEVPHVYSVPCTGTAGSGTLALLGLEKTEKIAHFTLATRNKTEELFAALTREVQIDLPQRGIALALPLTSISGAMALRGFAGGHENDEMTKEPYPMQTDKELIVIICENGHTDEVMQAARAAGAGGGTVLHAKGTGTAIAEKFYGISLAEEKEMVFIVTRAEEKRAIMEGVTEKAGLNTPARAVSFSLPVSETAGLRFFEK